MFTVVHLHLTVCPHETRGTDTGVAALASVLANPAILAGGVVGAIVQILVTKESSPALHTITLPGLRARAVQTSRVTNACVAEDPLVPRPTLAFVGFVTETMVRVAARQTHSLVTVVALPSLHADFLSVLVADVVTELVVPGSTEAYTTRTVVVLVAFHFVRVLQSHGVLRSRELFP